MCQEDSREDTDLSCYHDEGAVGVESLYAGEEVIILGISRVPEKLPPRQKLHSQKADIYNADEVARLVAGHVAVISAFSPSKTDLDIRQKHVQGIKTMIAAMKPTGINGFSWWPVPEFSRLSRVSA